VELAIARKARGTSVTWFWDEVRWTWPHTLVETVAGVRLASRKALAGYRSNRAAIHAARPVSSRPATPAVERSGR